MIDFIDYKILFKLAKVQNLHSVHWSDRSGWEISKYLDLEEIDDLSQKGKTNKIYFTFI